MKPLVLILLAFLSLACGGQPEHADATDQAATPSAAAPAAENKVSFSGGSHIAVVVDEDWKRIDEFTRRLYAGELSALYENFSDSAKQELSLDALLAMRSGLLANHGEEVEVVARTKEQKKGYTAYKRAARFSVGDRLVEVAWVIAPDDSIAGLYVTPERDEAK